MILKDNAIKIRPLIQAVNKTTIQANTRYILAVFISAPKIAEQYLRKINSFKEEHALNDIYSEVFIDALVNKNLDTIRKIPKTDLHNHFPLGGNREYIRKLVGIEIPFYDGVLTSMQDMHDWNSKYLGDKFNNSGLSRHCSIKYLMDCLKPFWGRKEFYSIDLYADEFAQPIENFIPIYQLAKENGLRLKAHIGEWGTAKLTEHAAWNIIWMIIPSARIVNSYLLKN
ncbi:MAG: putative adenosine/adenine deaminase [Anaerocolumna sp.]|jgi:hypothetical protein|nr:putative adenosine/adenine deaminase [Anaerocolumna sp.]